IFDVAEQYNDKKKTVISLENTKRGMLSEVYNLERKTRKIVEEKSALKNKNVKLKRSLKKISEDIVKIENELKEMTPRLQKRLGYVHKIQDLPWMYAFLSSYSITELDRMVNTFKNINKQEAKITIGYFNKREKLQKKREELKVIAKNLVELNKNIDKKESDIKSQHNKKKQLLSRIQSSIDDEKNKLSKIKSKGQKLAKKSEFANLEILFSTSFFDKKGFLPHPVGSPIAHGYGLHDLLIRDNVELLHKGHFYKAHKGTQVKVIESGRVKKIEYVRGLGHVIIVDHGSRYYTVYSNLHKVNVKEGEVLNALQKIAQVGNDSLLFNGGLYFEIRHFSEPEDPGQWLKKRDKTKLAGM
ncbi:MAG: peptidoglycan DD-metalloendopeptidase family protein, partial [Bdellovibrionales bacterium]|nr:peptidoglycan DD-metalloendopeptidase family protein [Bdellovibrionales bacterium]